MRVPCSHRHHQTQSVLSILATSSTGLTLWEKMTITTFVRSAQLKQKVGPLRNLHDTLLRPSLTMTSLSWCFNPQCQGNLSDSCSMLSNAAPVVTIRLLLGIMMTWMLCGRRLLTLFHLYVAITVFVSVVLHWYKPCICSSGPNPYLSLTMANLSITHSETTHYGNGV
jgi:hypothetical protein